MLCELEQVTVFAEPVSSFANKMIVPALEGYLEESEELLCGRQSSAALWWYWWHGGGVIASKTKGRMRAWAERNQDGVAWVRTPNGDQDHI